MSRSLPVARVSALACFAAAVIPAAASAQWMKPGDETLSLRVGAVSQNFDTTARVDGTAILGTTLNLERDLGLAGDKSTYILQGSWRIAPNHRVDGLYSDVSRSSSRTIDRSITIGNVTLPVSAVLSAEQKTAIGYVGYRYSLIKSQGAEIAAGVGAYGGNFKARFSANNPSLNTDQSTTVPLPVLAVSADAYLSERMTLNGTLRGLKVKVNGVDGQVYSLGAAVEYLVTNNVGVGLGFERFNISADARKTNFNGRLELDSTAGRLYLTARF